MSAERGTPVAAQRAFVELLTRPLVTPTSAPELHRDLVHHMKVIAASARRLGYRVATVGRAIRLVRVPVAGDVTAPTVPSDAPTRRVLAITCALAAACEDSRGGVTLAKLSDLVSQLTGSPTSPVTAYDPSMLVHRRQLLRAAHILEHWGVLRRRTADTRLEEDWAGAGEGIGAGYDIDRDALLLMTSPDVLALALDTTPASPEQLSSSRTLRAMRALVETPAVVYGDLDPDDAQALRATRGLRSSDVVALTGGHIEARTEGLILILPDEPPSSATVDWPRARVSSWLALLMADCAGRAGTRREDGSVYLSETQVDDCADDLRTWKQAYLSKALKDDTAQVRIEAEVELRHLGLLRTPPTGGWVLSPIAGRYRDPDINETTTHPNAFDADQFDQELPA